MQYLFRNLLTILSKLNIFTKFAGTNGQKDETISLLKYFKMPKYNCGVL